MYIKNEKKLKINLIEIIYAIQLYMITLIKTDKSFFKL